MVQPITAETSRRHHVCLDKYGTRLLCSLYPVMRIRGFPCGGAFVAGVALTVILAGFIFNAM